MIARETPNDFMFNKYFGKLEWIAENHVRLLDKTSNLVGEVYLE